LEKKMERVWDGWALVFVMFWRAEELSKKK
jgi:hypothetical protein